VQTETIVFLLGNKIKFSSAVLIFGSRSMVALLVLLSPHQEGIKQSRRWSHSIWSLDKLGAAFPRV